MLELPLNHIVRDAAARPEIGAAMASFYARAQQAIDARRPLCVISGRCCRFEEYGHRLFVTTLELAAFVQAREKARANALDAAPSWDGAGCPYQVNKLCGVHASRPFGCRIFFCDATAADWQNQAYEHFHADLKHLHETLAVPYRYVEWRAALRELNLVDAPQT